MSIPSVPGFTARPETLETLWQKPDGDWPAELWPRAALREITPTPTDWVVVAQLRDGGDEFDAAVKSVLIAREDVEEALRTDSWTGSFVGTAAITTGSDREETFEEGLTVDDFGISVGFFCQARHHHGRAVPTVEFHLPFLWYWDAIPRGESWYYLDEAGRDQELIRVIRDNGKYRVEVRALPLRRYLARADRMLLVQYDAHRHVREPEVQRIDSQYRDHWCYFTWHCSTMSDALSLPPTFSRLLGKYVIGPAAQIPGPRMEERGHRGAYAEFIVGVDPSTGEPLRHTCNPDELGTYFDEDNSRLHYLTPVNFDREVLARYTSQPRRYRVTSSYLSCLDLWGLQIGRNTAGLVEVYLGDLGRDLPSSEWQHWLAHNVPPSGEMSEERFRRDFLNQWVNSGDLASNLRSAHRSANEASVPVLGIPLWRELSEPTKSQYESLHAPLTSDPLALESPVLTLCKALVDAIDVRSLRAYLHEQDTRIGGLGLLDQLVESAGGDKELLVRPLRNLYALRSQGGIAHLSGADRERLLARLSLLDADSIQVFETVCGQALTALRGLAQVFEGLQEPASVTPVEGEAT